MVFDGMFSRFPSLVYVLKYEMLSWACLKKMVLSHLLASDIECVSNRFISGHV